jgi:lysophospholipase L1-like esterase
MRIRAARKPLLAVVALLLGTAVALAIAEPLMRIWRPRPGVLFPVGTTDFERAPKARWYGWAHVPNSTIEVRNPDTGAVFLQNMNSQGWHDVEHDPTPAPKKLRVLVVGDSFTQGYVPLEQLYTRRLQARLRASGLDAEVISMGEGGFATDQALEILLREADDYAPDWVVYQYFPNDSKGNFHPHRDGPDRTLLPGQPPNFRWPIERKLFRYDLRDGELIKRDFLVEGPLTNEWAYRANRWLSGAMRHSALVYNVVMATGTLGWTGLYRYDTRIDHQRLPERDPQPATEKLIGLIELMHERSESIGARFIVFPLGMDAHSIGLLQETANGRYEVLRPTRKYERYRTDPHSNDKGNAQMAADLAQFLLPRIGVDAAGPSRARVPSKRKRRRTPGSQSPP